MSAGTALKAFIVWLGILVMAVANGFLRNYLLHPVFGETAGLVTSGILLSGMILAVAYAALPRFGRLPARHYLLMGLFWLCLTLVFEIAFGRLQGKPWSQLLEAYTFSKGNLWPIVLCFTAAAPWVAARVRDWV